MYRPFGEHTSARLFSGRQLTKATNGPRIRLRDDFSFTGCNDDAIASSSLMLSPVVAQTSNRTPRTRRQPPAGAGGTTPPHVGRSGSARCLRERQRVRTPLERPRGLPGDGAGHHAEELASIRQARSADGCRVAGRARAWPRDWWLQNLDLSKRSRRGSSSIRGWKNSRVTPEAQKRIQAAGRVRSSFVGGPFDGPEDSQFPRAMHHAQCARLHDPVMYGNSYEIYRPPLRRHHLRNHP